MDNWNNPESKATNNKTVEENDVVEKEEKKERRQQLKLECLGYALALKLKDENGDQSLNKDQVLEAAKTFYNFVRT